MHYTHKETVVVAKPKGLISVQNKNGDKYRTISDRSLKIFKGHVQNQNQF